MKRVEWWTALLRFFFDGIGIFLAFLLAYFWRVEFYEVHIFFHSLSFFPPPATLIPFQTFLSYALTFTLVLLAVLALNGRYRIEWDKPWESYLKAFWAFSAGMALILVYFFFAKWQFFSRLIFGLAWVLGVVLLLLSEILVTLIIRLLQRFDMAKTEVLLIGDGRLAEKVLSHLPHCPWVHFQGFLGKNSLKNKKPLGEITTLEKHLKALPVEEIWIAHRGLSEQSIAFIIDLAHAHHKKVRIFPNALELDLASVKATTFEGMPVITLLSNRISGWWAFWKYTFETLLALLLLILLSPLLLLLALLVYFENPKAPILYFSRRIGKNQKPFWCWKFRTMVPDADKQKKYLKSQRKGGVLFKIENDPRVTPIGRILRRFSLDELPQLINVLKGDMGLIGPRPHLEEEVAKYPQKYLPILSVRPGITGFSQVNGGSQLSFEEEMEYELFYLKNWSFWMDMIIFVKSIYIVFRGSNR